MRETTVCHCSVMQLPRMTNGAASRTAINTGKEVPFDIQRVYYMYDIPGGEVRGGHGHRALEQLVVAANGSFDVIVNDGETKRTFHLSRPDIGLHMPPGLWRELDNFSSGAICLVLASHPYDEADYLRDYEDFLHYKAKTDKS